MFVKDNFVNRNEIRKKAFTVFLDWYFGLHLYSAYSSNFQDWIHPSKKLLKDKKQISVKLFDKKHAQKCELTIHLLLYLITFFFVYKNLYESEFN